MTLIDLKPVHINNAVAKTGEVASPNGIQSRSKHPLNWNGKPIKNDSRSGGDASRKQNVAIASLLAGATEAFRVAKEPGGWRGEKAKRILTAAAGAATVDAAHGADHGKLGLAESVIGGLIGNRLINGSRSDVEEDRHASRSRSRSHTRSKDGGGGQSESPAESPRSATHPAQNRSAMHRPSANILVATETDLSSISPVDEYGNI